MDNIKIILEDQGSPPIQYDVSYIQEIPMSLNFAIADIRNPDKRQTTFSKTIHLPGTKEINQFFELIWRTNVNLQTFNPNLKCRIFYYINGVEQLRGDLQLLSVEVDDANGGVNYEISATGRTGSLFIEMGDKLITGNADPNDDIDFSEYNHILNGTNIDNSWDTSIIKNGSSQAFQLGEGYVYGHIDHGKNLGNLNDFWIKDFRPQFYKYTLLSKIFAKHGKTFESNYFTSTYFKRQVIPATAQEIKLAAADINDSQFYARRNANQVGSNTTLNYTSAWVSPTNGTSTVVLFNEDNVSPYNDAGNQYNTGTGVATIGNTNLYNLTTIINFDLVITNSLGTATNMVINTGQVAVVIKKLNGAVWQTVAISTYFVNAVYPTLTASGQVAVTLPGSFTVNEQFRVEVYPFQLNLDLYTAGMVLVTTGTTTAAITFKTNSTYYLTLQNTDITEGYTIEMNQALPANIKQVDWLMSELKAANIYMDIDKDDNNNYILEPYDDFFTGEEDWSELYDISKKRTVKPMGSVDWKKRVFTYKSDEDEYNQLYEKEFKEVYGSFTKEIQNDFIKPTNTTELIYSATPVVGNLVNGLVIPKIYKVDNGVIKPFKSNIRSLYYGGRINLTFGSWTLKSNTAADVIYTDFAYVGHNDNPYNPTIDLLWDQPKRVYYNYPTATYTDNNLYNRYYSRYINQITDKNSKIEIIWMNLKEYDIKKFDFRTIKFVGNPLYAYYNVNTISNYDVYKRKSTEVELLKLTDYVAFTPSHIRVVEDPWVNQETNRIINGNATNGDNNTNFGAASTISGGSGNFIASGSERINLINCTGVVVQGDVENFTGIGLSNVVVTNAQSNSTLMGGDPPSRTLTTSTTLDWTYNNQIVYLDATSGNMTITWDYTTMADFKVYFKRIDNTANTISITDLDVTVTFEGTIVPVNLGLIQYDALTLTSTGRSIYII